MSGCSLLPSMTQCAIRLVGDGGAATISGGWKGYWTRDHARTPTRISVPVFEDRRRTRRSQTHSSDSKTSPIRERLRCAHEMLTKFRARLMRENVEGGFSGRSDVDRDTIESHRIIEHLDSSLPDVCQTRLV